MLFSGRVRDVLTDNWFPVVVPGACALQDGAIGKVLSVRVGDIDC